MYDISNLRVKHLSVKEHLVKLTLALWDLIPKRDLALHVQRHVPNST